jgi:hypothetical protein
MAAESHLARGDLLDMPSSIQMMGFVCDMPSSIQMMGFVC